jgi:hypothetical protein
MIARCPGRPPSPARPVGESNLWGTPPGRGDADAEGRHARHCGGHGGRGGGGRAGAGPGRPVGPAEPSAARDVEGAPARTAGITARHGVTARHGCDHGATRRGWTRNRGDSTARRTWMGEERRRQGGVQGWGVGGISTGSTGPRGGGAAGGEAHVPPQLLPLPQATPPPPPPTPVGCRSLPPRSQALPGRPPARGGGVCGGRGARAAPLGPCPTP